MYHTAAEDSPAVSISLTVNSKVLIMAYKAACELASAFLCPVPIAPCHPSPLVFGQFLERAKCQVLSRLKNFVLAFPSAWNTLSLVFHVSGSFLAEMSPLWVACPVFLSRISSSIFLYNSTPFLIDWSQLIITYLLTCFLGSGSLGIDPEKKIQEQWYIKEIPLGKWVRVWGKQNGDGEEGK